MHTAKAEVRIAESATIYASGGAKVGSIIAKKVPNYPGVEEGFSWAESNAYNLVKDWTEIYNVQVFLRNPGPDKNWKHSTRGFDY